MKPIKKGAWHEAQGAGGKEEEHKPICFISLIGCISLIRFNQLY
jgi:hypothetical protein